MKTNHPANCCRFRNSHSKKSDSQRTQNPPGRSSCPTRPGEPPPGFYTLHARARIQQRGITDEMVKTVLACGKPRWTYRGCRLYFITRRQARLATSQGQAIEFARGIGVITDKHRIVTVLHIDKLRRALGTAKPRCRQKESRKHGFRWRRA